MRRLTTEKNKAENKLDHLKKVDQGMRCIYGRSFHSEKIRKLGAFILACRTAEGLSDVFIKEK